MLHETQSVALRAILLSLAYVFSCLLQAVAQQPAQVGVALKTSMLPILVVDSNGQPIPGVNVVPWALGCGQGHGVWGPFEGKPDESGMEPKPVMTDDQGIAEITYPFFRSAQEKTRTLVVSVRFVHPEYSYADAEHIDVPLEHEGPYKISMKSAASIEIEPLIDSQPVETDELYAIWSNQRSWQVDGTPEKLASGKLRIDGFLPGPNSVLIIRMVDDTITHFSEIKQLEMDEGSVNELAMPLLPVVRIVGKLSANVPRPVRDGRVLARTIPRKSIANRTMWTDWTPVAEDGSFEFNAWPQNEPIQLIALCDDFIATSGKAPNKELEFPNDGYHRPHAFNAGETEIIIPMMPLVPVSVTVTNQDKVPVAGLDLGTSPNVGWWNYGAQIYGLPMVSGKKLLRQREYLKAAENPYPNMFRGLTDSRGQITFRLPLGKQYLEVLSDAYELPIELGRRAGRPLVEEGKPLQISLRVQPIGTEMLGDWDKLAGVVYGCSTVEGHRILALPGMKEKVKEFVEQFSDAKNQENPELLAEAYLTLAAAFLSVDDQQEALKWRKKAKELQLSGHVPPSDLNADQTTGQTRP